MFSSRLANKQDKMNALLGSELIEILSLEKLVNQSRSLCHIVSVERNSWTILSIFGVLEEKSRGTDLFSFPPLRSPVQPYWTYDAGRTGRPWEAFGGCCVQFAWITPSCVLVWLRTGRGLRRKERRKRTGKMRKCAEKPKEIGENLSYPLIFSLLGKHLPQWKVLVWAFIVKRFLLSDWDPASQIFAKSIGQKTRRRGLRGKESCNLSETCCQRLE